VGLALFGTGLLRLLQHRLPATRMGPRLPAQAAEPIEDGLTRLLTRSHLETELAAAVVQCDANGGKLALLFIDLDGFKPVNDTFGHSSGDRVLRKVGKRLKDSADKGDVIARIGGDEFLIMIGNVGSQDALAQRARKIVETIAHPFNIEDRKVTIGCSVGIAVYPDSGQHAKLISRADAAMYAAKRAGGAGYCFFTAEMEDDSRERFDLLRDLRLALERKEFELYYQPKMDAATGKVTAAEALLRWQHPTRGMVSPSVFIPIAERFGLIRAIGQWVIDDACRQARVWLDRGFKMRVAINLSAAQMRQEDIVARIEGALATHQVDPSLLTCEITESVAMEDTKATQATFRELGSAGIHLAIDDFGTGYSSLAYLRKLPAEELKIDRSFVMDVEFSADARAVVDAVVKLAHALGLKVVAEGVENERQHRILVQLGCDELQGFLFAKPMTARALLLWAMDDRQQAVQSFATSLFATTRNVAPAITPNRNAGDAAADGDGVAARRTPQVH
jgi:diguanylate cyclase (GGDEF)-like protein